MTLSLPARFELALFEHPIRTTWESMPCAAYGAIPSVGLVVATIRRGGPKHALRNLEGTYQVPWLRPLDDQYLSHSVEGICTTWMSLPLTDNFPRMAGHASTAAWIRIPTCIGPPAAAMLESLRLDRFRPLLDSMERDMHRSQRLPLSGGRERGLDLDRPASPRVCIPRAGRPVQWQ
jgi:hypothetical protein